MAAEDTRVNELRAEAMAHLYLTQRGDLDVLRVSHANSRAGYDLLVRVDTGNTVPWPEFGVEVQGVRKRIGKERPVIEFRLTADQIEGAGLPICLFCFNVATGDGFYHWLHRPVSTPDGRRTLLTEFESQPVAANGRAARIARAEFRPLDDHALDEIVARVIQWYGAVQRMRAS